ncbi:MAG: VWA domain-containing protein [Candidatus Aminicenantes bacterium]|nr:VWA domain-containing protein [Candidatus Aminicenantes bacterium]
MRKCVFAKIFILTALFFAVMAVVSPLWADGFIIPRPKPGEKIPMLTVKYHRVHVNISGQTAETSIDQVFINNHHREIEGIFIFPLPEKAAISDFSMYVGGKEVKGEILDRDRARKIYEDIVRRMKDPALLEYAGRNMFRARIYPIPARGEKRVKLSYSEVLTEENRVVRYIYPLNTERFSFQPIEEVIVSVNIDARMDLTNIYSPSHKISVRKLSRQKARVSFEEKQVKPDKDFVLYYAQSKEEMGLSFINWQDNDSGYYMFLASPAYAEQKEKVIAKNLVFVLDSSGSMSGQKITQAKAAVRFIVQHLNTEDRFSLIDFDDGVDLFSSVLLPAEEKNLEAALRFVEEVEDAGGTNIDEALQKAVELIGEGERPHYILFLTDGLPTVGVTDTAQILKNISQRNRFHARLFVFGVGYDVNTELLDRMSAENRGTSLYVKPGENLEVAVSRYYEKISSPLLSDLEVDFKGIEVKHSYPRTLPDLFKGSQLILIGKYSGSGPVSITLSGKVGQDKRSYVLENQTLEKSDRYRFLPRIWAARRVGYLLEEIRLNGERTELVEEIKKLGLKYGIVTPYTSFLVTDEEVHAVDIAAPEAAKAFAAGKKTGEGAVRMAQATQRLKDEEQTIRVESQRIRYKEDKTFYLREDVWVDSIFQEGSPVEEIYFGTEEYFELIKRKPGIEKYLSLAKNIIICFEGRCYRIKS